MMKTIVDLFQVVMIYRSLFVVLTQVVLLTKVNVWHNLRYAQLENYALTVVRQNVEYIMGALQTTFSAKMDNAQLQYLVVSDTQIALLKLLFGVVIRAVLRIKFYVQDLHDHILL